MINSIINVDGEDEVLFSCRAFPPFIDGLAGAERGGRHVGRELYPEQEQGQDNNNEDLDLQKVRVSL